MSKDPTQPVTRRRPAKDEHSNHPDAPQKSAKKPPEEAKEAQYVRDASPTTRGPKIQSRRLAHLPGEAQPEISNTHKNGDKSPVPPPQSDKADDSAPQKTAEDQLTGRKQRPTRQPSAAKNPDNDVQQPTPENRPMPSTDDFAAMFGETNFNFKEVEAGDRVNATIVSIDDDNLFVDLGAKAEGSVNRNDLTNKDGDLDYQIGDSLELYVISTKDGNIQLSTVLRQVDAGIDILAEAHAQQIPVEGRVTGVNKGGFDVEIAGKRAFCPLSQLTIRPIDEPESFIGLTRSFLVTRTDDGGRNIVVSARALEEAQRHERAEKLLQTLEPNSELVGTVSRITDFGAFVDIGGIDGLVHVSEMSWARDQSPSDLAQEGQPVRVKVLSIETEGRGDRPRISLSMKALEDDPFIAGLQEINIGQTLKGTITRIATFGAFVEIKPGLEGLVHISELAAGRRIQHPSQIVNPGDVVEVQVLDLDPQKRRVSLSMARLMDDPWAQAAVQLPPGTEIQGTIDGLESFGVFVELANGLRALLPWSQLAPGEDKSQHKIFAVGNVISARVLDVDVGRSRMSLTRKDVSAAQGERAAVQSQMQKQSQQNASFGTFADLLKDKL